MDDFGVTARPLAKGHDGGLDYLLDMIAELAKLARSSGEPAVAIHLEAILAAHEAMLANPSRER